MSTPSAEEQYLLELINAERARAGVQPLAGQGQLNTAADLHSQWMIDTDTFSHTGAGGSTATQRMQSAGYQLSGSWATGENIAWVSLRTPEGYSDEVRLLHTNLMNSPGHKANILNGTFQQVGLGLRFGEYQGWQGAFVTENFAKSGDTRFITGVAYADRDGDSGYDPGEGLGGLTVTASSTTGATYVTQTHSAGGYDMAVPSGTYNLTFSGSGYATSTRQITVGMGNLKADLVNPAAGTTSTPPPAPAPTPTAPTAGQTLTGAYTADVLNGGAGADTISGLGGSDRLGGGGGADRLDAGGGADTLTGGAGPDTLTGGSGSDTFVFDLRPAAGEVDRLTDFNAWYDTMAMNGAAFTGVGGPGTLSGEAFWRGASAHDATDRIIYNPQTGALTYDPDGLGGAQGQVMAQLSTGLSLTNSDFLVY